MSVQVGDALLHAINEENVEAVELLLNHEAATKGEDVSSILCRVIYLFVFPTGVCCTIPLGKCIAPFLQSLH